jgi:hypothetical protein
MRTHLGVKRAERAELRYSIRRGSGISKFSITKMVISSTRGRPPS